MDVIRKREDVDMKTFDWSFRIIRTLYFTCVKSDQELKWKLMKKKSKNINSEKKKNKIYFKKCKKKHNSWELEMNDIMFIEILT